MGRWTDRLRHRATLRHWQRMARAAQQTDLSTLRRTRNQARALRAQLDRLLHVADGRLALPMIGSSHFEKPHGTDWSWRPDAWRGPISPPGLAPAHNKARMGDQVTVFHDGTRAQITLHQIRNLRPDDLAPYGMRLDVLEFDGSFVSLAIELPPEAAQGLTRSHLIRLNMIVSSEHPIDIMTRLNIQHGPNTEQIKQGLPPDTTEPQVEYDMHYSTLNEKRIDKLWLDLIFQSPRMNQIHLRDLTLARHPRFAI
ncbi:hypothetical protein I5535_00280 [Rhodobacteraceae bacterium F11138]|nr:hypothetical protein [Rhodobacteraceae bacterium F11138]